MADAVRPRVRVPKSARRGELVEIKTLVQNHAMESGQRRDAAGNIVPRKILHAMDVTFNGKPVFSAKLHPAISANPYISFFMKIEESGALDFRWKDDDGTEYKAVERISVTA